MVKLKPVTLYDWRVEWIRLERNKPETLRGLRQTLPLSYTDQRRWFGTLNRDTVKLFTVHLDDPDSKIMGYVGLNPIDQRHSHAEFGIFITNEHRNKGYATEALKKLLEYGFKELKLHKIYSDVLDYPGENRFNFYNNLGFKMDGINRQHYFKEGKWINSVSFSMLSNEYEKCKNLLGPRKKTEINSELEKTSS